MNKIVENRRTYTYTHEWLRVIKGNSKSFAMQQKKNRKKENLIFSRRVQHSRRFMPLEQKLHSANIGLESRRRIDDSGAERKCSENPYECIVKREVNINKERCRRW